MFAMYDDDGLRFRSTIDSLYIEDINKVEALNNNKKDKQKGESPTFEQTLKKKKITQAAKEQYKKIASLDTRTEIFHTEQLMHTNIITASQNMSIKECYDLMQEHQIQQLPIICDEQKQLKAIVSLIDILQFLMDDTEYMHQTINKHLDTISTRKIITTDPVSDIRRVAKVLIDFNLNAILVVDSNHISVGIITRHDIIDAVSSIPHFQLWA